MKELGIIDLAKKYITLAKDSVDKVIAMIPRYQGKWFTYINKLLIYYLDIYFSSFSILFYI